MIDRPARAQLIALLRSLLAGGITSAELEAWQTSSRDHAVREVLAQAWLLEEDLRENRHSGERELATGDRREVSRWIVFLETDREYEWPALPRWARILGFIPSMLTFGLFWVPYRRWFERQGDARFWPFLSERQFRTGKASAAGRERTARQ